MRPHSRRIVVSGTGCKSGGAGDWPGIRRDGAAGRVAPPLVTLTPVPGSARQRGQQIGGAASTSAAVSRNGRAGVASSSPPEAAGSGMLQWMQPG